MLSYLEEKVKSGAGEAEEGKKKRKKVEKDCENCLLHFLDVSAIILPNERGGVLHGKDEFLYEA